MLRVALLAIALLSSACSSTLYTENRDEVRIEFGGGGLFNSKLSEYAKIAAKHKRVVIDGQVISADAFLAFSLPGACYTKNAIFSPHAASYLGLIPAPQYTNLLASELPAPLEKWFRGNIAYYDWIGYATVSYKQLVKIWPQGACSNRRTANASAQYQKPTVVAFRKTS